MFSTSSVAVDPLIVQINEEMEELEPNVKTTQENLAELDNLVPKNLLSDIYRFRTDLDKINKDRERRNLFKHRVDEKSSLYDLETKLRDYTLENVRKSFFDLEDEITAKETEEPEDDDHIKAIRQKEKSIYNDTLSKISNISNKFDTAKSSSSKFELVPQFYTSKVEKDSEFLNTHVKELKTEIERCENDIQVNGRFQSKFGIQKTTEFEVLEDEDVDANGERIYKVPDLSNQFNSTYGDAQGIISSLNNEYSNLDLQFSMISDKINNLKTKLKETATNQDDIAVVLRETEDKALETLTKSDEITENLKKKDYSSDISSIQEKLSLNSKEIKSSLDEIRSIVDILELQTNDNYM